MTPRHACGRGSVLLKMRGFVLLSSLPALSRFAHRDALTPHYLGPLHHPQRDFLGALAFLAMGSRSTSSTVPLSTMYKSLGVSDGQNTVALGSVIVAWSLKPLWAAFLDMYRTKKFFVLAMELLIAVLFAGVAMALPLRDSFRSRSHCCGYRLSRHRPRISAAMEFISLRLIKKRRRHTRAFKARFGIWVRCLPTGF